MESFSIHYIPSEIRSFRLTKGNERYEIYLTCVMARERENERGKKKEKKRQIRAIFLLLIEHERF